MFRSKDTPIATYYTLCSVGMMFRSKDTPIATYYTLSLQQGKEILKYTYRDMTFEPTLRPGFPGPPGIPFLPGGP